MMSIFQISFVNVSSDLIDGLREVYIDSSVDSPIDWLIGLAGH